jgi:death-on-curing protein
VEYLHDDVVPAYMTFDEPVEPEKFKDLNLLDSAVNRPYQTWGAVDLYDSIFKKAAALFHSVACNHCFYNGNKRTAVLAVDSFLTANEIIVVVSNEDMYSLAKSAASANESGITPDSILATISEKLEEESVSIERLRAIDDSEPDKYPSITRLLQRAPTLIARVREHPRNQPHAQNNR